MTVPGSYKSLFMIFNCIKALKTIHKKVIYERTLSDG